MNYAYYRIYIDKIIVLLYSQDHMKILTKYLNFKRRSIKFDYKMKVIILSPFSIILSQRQSIV